jgi:regulatory protein
MAKGVAADDAMHAVEAVVDEAGGRTADPDLAAACVFARRRRFGPFRTVPAGDDTRMRELAAFGRAGFQRATAEAVIGCADPDDLAAMLKGDDAV